jgi:hypothetical protein
MAAIFHNKYGGECCLFWGSAKEDIGEEAEFPILSPVMAAGDDGCSCGNKWSLCFMGLRHRMAPKWI